jgi:hypothetical protein
VRAEDDERPSGSQVVPYAASKTGDKSGQPAETRDGKPRSERLECHGPRIQAMLTVWSYDGRRLELTTFLKPEEATETVADDVKRQEMDDGR